MNQIKQAICSVLPLLYYRGLAVPSVAVMLLGDTATRYLLFGSPANPMHDKVSPFRPTLAVKNNVDIELDTRVRQNNM